MKMLLVRTLIGVFAFQGVLLLVAFYKCQSPQMCPDLGSRTEKLFGIATATILSLLSAEKR
jgi:hypothetical protein